MILQYFFRINKCKESLQKEKRWELISKWKKMLGIGIVTGILAVITIPLASVQASSILDEVTETETTEDFAEDTSYSLLRGNNLAYGTVKILKKSSNEVGIYGLTQCHHTCGTVYLELYLERKVNGSYGTYKDWSFTANNVSSLSKTISVLVPSGTYYRVRGYHAAKEGSKESTSTLTSGILVN